MGAALPFFIDDLPGVWRGDAWAQAPQRAVDTGHEQLNAQLPGGGWPLAGMTELLLPIHAHCEWRLLAPALARLLADSSGHAVLVAPPLEPFMPALQAAGVPVPRLCCIRPVGSGAAMAAAWACEQALRCRDVRAVLAWLPQVAPAALRRLQLAAARQQQLLWVFRPVSAAPQASPALLRLQVQGRDGEPTGLRVRILKRRGPPLEQALDLPGCHPRLAQALAAQARRREAAQNAALQTLPQGTQHALDRAALAATA